MKTGKKIYIIIIIFAFIILSLIVFLIYPTFKSIKDGSEEILSSKNKTISINAETMELDSFKKNYKNYKPNLDKIDQLFVDLANLVDFIKFLEKVALDSGINADINLVNSKQEKINNFPVVLFQVSAKGDFLNMLKFIDKLETGPYLIRIENLTFKKSEKEITEDKNISSILDSDFLIGVATK